MVKKRTRKLQPIRLMIVTNPDPKTRTIIEYTGEGTVIIRGEDATTTRSMVCGNCLAPLVVGVRVDAVRGLILRCSRCGSYNETLIS